MENLKNYYFDDEMTVQNIHGHYVPTLPGVSKNARTVIEQR